MKKVVCLGIALALAAYAGADTITINPADYYNPYLDVAGQAPFERYDSEDPLTGVVITADGLGHGRRRHTARGHRGRRRCGHWRW